jgi:hypothetical protein
MERAVPAYSTTMVVSRAVTKQAAIAITIAAAYFGLAMISPITAIFAIPSLTFIGSLRWSNILRSFVIAWPGAAFGIALGSYAVSVQTGKIALGAYSVMPLIILVIGIGFYGLAKFWGRSLAKDLILTAGYGLASGLVVSLNLVALNVIFDGAVWSTLLNAAIMYKVGVHVVLALAGYPLMRAFEKGRKHEENPSYE